MSSAGGRQRRHIAAVHMKGNKRSERSTGQNRQHTDQRYGDTRELKRRKALAQEDP
jgi:hypothetical protein